MISESEKPGRVMPFVITGLVAGAAIGSGMVDSVQDMTHRSMPGLKAVAATTGLLLGPLGGFLAAKRLAQAGVGWSEIGRAGWWKVGLTCAVTGSLGAIVGLVLGIAWMQVVPSGDLLWVAFSIMGGLVGTFLPMRWFGR